MAADFGAAKGKYVGNIRATMAFNAADLGAAKGNYMYRNKTFGMRDLNNLMYKDYDLVLVILINNSFKSIEIYTKYNYM